MVEIHPLLPDLFFRQLEARDAEGALRSIENARDLGDGRRHILRGMRRFSAHHQPRPGETPACVVIDAVADMAPAYGDHFPVGLLNAATHYLMGLETAHPRIDLFDLPPSVPSVDVVPVASLEDAVAEGDLEETCRTVARLVRVIRTREYFLEVLLDVVAPERSEDGGLLVLTDATVKCLHEMEWEAGRGIALRLLEALSLQPIETAPGISKLPSPVPCRAGYLATLDRPHPEKLWLYLAHAFQAERYAQLRAKGVRWGLRSWIAARLFDGDEVRMEGIEEGLGPRRRRESGEGVAPLAEAEGSALASAISNRSSEAAAWAGSLAARSFDPDAVYRWIVEPAIASLARGDPEPLLALNGARWGTHLLDPENGRALTEKLVSRLIDLGGGPP